MANFLLKFKSLFRSAMGFFKQDPFPLFTVLLSLVICDQVLKKICLFFSLRTNSFLGFALNLIPNENFVLSLELTTDHFFKTVIITPIFVWIVFSYFLSVLLYSKKYEIYKMGLDSGSQRRFK